MKDLKLYIHLDNGDFNAEYEQGIIDFEMKHCHGDWVIVTNNLLSTEQYCKISRLLAEIKLENRENSK